MQAAKKRRGGTIIEYGMIAIAVLIAASCIYFGLSH